MSTNNLLIIMFNPSLDNTANRRYVLSALRGMSPLMFERLFPLPLALEKLGLHIDDFVQKDADFAACLSLLSSIEGLVPASVVFACSREALAAHAAAALSHELFEAFQWLVFKTYAQPAFSTLH